MSGRFENFTPPTLGSELTAAEITMVEGLTALANSGTGEFIRKSAGSLVNATLSETVALAGLSDVAISGAANGHVLSYNGSSWVNSSLSETISLSELDDVAFSGLAINNILIWNGSSWVNGDRTTGVGTVTTVSVVTANGVSGIVATATTTPAITLTLGAITPSSIVVDDITINGNTISSAGASTLAINPTVGQSITFDSTVTLDAGVIAGATSITSTAFAGALTGNASTATTLETARTIGGVSFNGSANITVASATGGFTVSGGDLALGANSLTSSDASPFVLTNGQAVTIALTAQTIGTAILTIPDFANVSDTFVFITLAQTLSNKTFVAPALGTPVSGTLTNCTGLPVAGITASTITALGVGSIELGHATDTTIARSGAGAITVEGVQVILSGAALGTPSSGTGTNITGIPAANILAGSFGAGAYVISTSLQVATIELGAATDTTLARVSAGVVSIEGVNILTTAGGTLTGNITLGEGADPATIGIVMDNSMSADERYSGITVPGTAGATLAFGDICYLDVTATEWLLADASAATTAGDVVLGICVDASTDGAATSMLLIGTVRSAAFPASIALGAPVYISETAGDVTATAPVTTDSVMRRVGFAVTAEPNTIFFSPSNDYVTHT